jgi:hypothetical protein
MSEILSARHSRALFVASLLFALFICVFLSGASRAQAQQVGYVVDFEGRWLVNGGQPIARTGQSLQGGGTISRQSASADDRISIADLNGKIVIHKNCATRGECDSPIQLASPPRQRGLVATAFGAVMSLVWGEPDRYSVHRSRDGELHDGVLQMKGDEIDLAAVFKTSESGKYYLRFVRVASGDKPPGSKSLGPIIFNFDPKHPSPVSVPGLQSGVYEVVLLEHQNEAYSPTDVTAWLLVRNAKEYQKSLASYEQAVALTRTWAADVTPEATRGFLRAQLDQLAKTSAK